MYQVVLESIHFKGPHEATDFDACFKAHLPYITTYNSVYIYNTYLQ